MHEDILELGAIAPERPKARLRTPEDPDGTIYELAVPEEFGAAEMQRVGVLIREMDALWGKQRLNKAEQKRLEKLLNDIVGRLIVDAPADAIAALPAVDKRSVAARFFVAGAARMAGQFKGAPGFPSESSPPASSASTEETPEPGSS